MVREQVVQQALQVVSLCNLETQFLEQGFQILLTRLLTQEADVVMCRL
jgi:hypothetical protein